jgi:hypothetical protein
MLDLILFGRKAERIEAFARMYVIDRWCLACWQRSLLRKADCHELKSRVGDRLLGVESSLKHGAAQDKLMRCLALQLTRSIRSHL